jgi:hypothetical protein
VEEAQDIGAEHATSRDDEPKANPAGRNKTGGQVTVYATITDATLAALPGILDQARPDTTTPPPP